MNRSRNNSFRQEERTAGQRTGSGVLFGRGDGGMRSADCEAGAECSKEASGQCVHAMELAALRSEYLLQRNTLERTKEQYKGARRELEALRGTQGRCTLLQGEVLRVRQSLERSLAEADRWRSRCAALEEELAQARAEDDKGGSGEEENGEGEGRQHARLQHLREMAQALREVDSAEVFEVEKVMGNGSFGMVLRCRVLRRYVVALKVLYNLGHATSRVEHAFASEHAILSQLPMHPNIVCLLHQFRARPSAQLIGLMHPDARVHAIKRNRFTGEEQPRTTQFVVFEFHPGSMVEYLDGLGPALTWEVIVEVCLGLAEGLLFLWQHRVVHRDMKLENVLACAPHSFRSRPCAVIADFGTAVRCDANGCVDVRLHGMGGNLLHTAPEVMLSLKAIEDERLRDTSVCYRWQPAWALGVLCFEISSGGEHPFEGYPLLDWTSPPPLFAVNSSQMRNVPNEFREMVCALLRTDPAARLGLDEATAVLRLLSGTHSPEAGAGAQPDHLTAGPSSTSHGDPSRRVARVFTAPDDTPTPKAPRTREPLFRAGSAVTHAEEQQQRMGERPRYGAFAVSPPPLQYAPPGSGMGQPERRGGTQEMTAPFSAGTRATQQRQQQQQQQQQQHIYF